MQANTVFINCPFDPDYYPLFRAMVFTCLYLGYEPIISDGDSGSIRISNIISHIKECRYSIHDLSKIELDKSSNKPRFNMPFEFGIDYGLRHSGFQEMNKKRFLVFERKSYDSKAALSDIAGSDLKSHNDKQEVIIKHIRSFFYAEDLMNFPLFSEIEAEFKSYEFGFISTVKLSLGSKRPTKRQIFDFMPFDELKGSIRKFLHSLNA